MPIINAGSALDSRSIKFAIDSRSCIVSLSTRMTGYAEKRSLRKLRSAVCRCQFRPVDGRHIEGSAWVGHCVGHNGGNVALLVSCAASCAITIRTIADPSTVMTNHCGSEATSVKHLMPAGQGQSIFPMSSLDRPADRSRLLMSICRSNGSEPWPRAE